MSPSPYRKGRPRYTPLTLRTIAQHILPRSHRHLSAPRSASSPHQRLPAMPQCLTERRPSGARRDSTQSKRPHRQARILWIHVHLTTRLPPKRFLPQSTSAQERPGLDCWAVQAARRDIVVTSLACPMIPLNVAAACACATAAWSAYWPASEVSKAARSTARSLRLCSVGPSPEDRS